MKETSVHAIASRTNTHKRSIVFALGFLHLGEENGTIDPGDANIQLAHLLERCAGWFSLVLTEKVISDALTSPHALPDGTPVYQMHRNNPRVPVRTLAALMCGLERLPVVPDQVVLLAHPRHIRRALMDLRALYSGEILALHPGQVIYPSRHWRWAIYWALKSALAWPVDFLLIQSIRYPALGLLWTILEKLGGRMRCPKNSRLPKIVPVDG